MAGLRRSNAPVPKFPRYIILLLSLALLFLSGCESELDPVGASPSPQTSPGGGTATPSPSPGDQGDNIRLQKTTIKTRQGQKWEMEAESVDWMDGRSQAKATNVDWWLVDAKGKRWVKVESPTADVDMDREVVTFEGETVATRLGFPESLKVKKLVYKGKDRKFYGSGGVLWKRANVELSGETLTATAELDKVQLKGKVKGKSRGGLEGLKLSEDAD